MSIFHLASYFLISAAIVALLCILLGQRRNNRDLIARLAGEEQRRSESERAQSLMFSSNPHPMWVFDCESLRFLKVNDAAVHSYGYSRDEFLRMTLREIRPADDLAALERAAQERHNGHYRLGILAASSQGRQHFTC